MTQRNCLLPLLMLAAIPAVGQITNKDTTSAEEQEPLQYYQIELVVFRHIDQSHTTAEIPRMPKPEMSDFLEQDLARLVGPTPLNQTTPATTTNIIKRTDTAETSIENTGEESAMVWIPVNPEGLLLTKMVSEIERIPAYELLSYLSWAQLVQDATVAQAIDLEEIGADKALVTGNIELHERRYLHLSLEVLLSDPDGVPDYTLLGPFSEPMSLPAIKDSRRIRLEKVQYFDQPQFGVIAVVSRLKVPEEV